ncbi:MAG: helix-turn-helix transcriptional regulator [Lachnospiraceae bacterium]|nr:helix-turn-helix transcriptional regulator [Lachnospiraceae bacterium]
MANRIIYPNIDMQKTGRKLKRIIESAGFTPRMIQEYLHLSCVQPIYRWYKGLILPSVDHLFMLSELLNVHMEDLLVRKNLMAFTFDIEPYNMRAAQRRILLYCQKIYQSVA